MWFKSLVFIIAAALLTAGCKPEVINPDASGLNVINTSPGTTALNFSLNGRAVSGAALGYNEQSGYFRAAVGILTFGITTAGSTASVTTKDITLVKSQYHSVFVIGPSNSISILQTDDDLTAPETGKAKIRFLNLGQDAPNLSLTTSAGSTLFSNMSFKSVSTFTPINPGSYTFQIKNVTSGMTLATLDKTIEAGYTYTFYSTGLVSGSGGTAISLQALFN